MFQTVHHHESHLFCWALLQKSAQNDTADENGLLFCGVVTRAEMFSNGTLHCIVIPLNIHQEKKSSVERTTIFASTIRFFVGYHKMTISFIVVYGIQPYVLQGR